MKSKIKTSWFPSQIRPVRSGWYECYGDWYEHKKIVKRFFDVEKGRWFWNSPEHGFHSAGFASTDLWRGLLKGK
jgi:hypothetical protein